MTLEDVVSDVEYLWVVDGERENLLDNDPFVHACTPVTDHYGYANRKWIHSTNGTSFVYDIYDFCKAQIVGVSGDPSMKSGGSTSLTISYDTSDNDAFLTGLGLRVHFDSSVLTYVDASDVVTVDTVLAHPLWLRMLMIMTMIHLLTLILLHIGRLCWQLAWVIAERSNDSKLQCC